MLNLPQPAKTFRKKIVTLKETETEEDFFESEKESLQSKVSWKEKTSLSSKEAYLMVSESVCWQLRL